MAKLRIVASENEFALLTQIRKTGILVSQGNHPPLSEILPEAIIQELTPLLIEAIRDASTGLTAPRNRTTLWELLNTPEPTPSKTKQTV